MVQWFSRVGLAIAGVFAFLSLVAWGSTCEGIFCEVAIALVATVLLVLALLAASIAPLFAVVLGAFDVVEVRRWQVILTMIVVSLALLGSIPYAFIAGAEGDTAAATGAGAVALAGMFVTTLLWPAWENAED